MPERTHDGGLLRDYLKHGDQAAFARLVERYLGLVYSACLRETGAAGPAEDAAQAVFLLLARKAPSLTARASLAGWLFAAARLVSRNARRQERRRQRQEIEAMEEMGRADRDAAADSAAWIEVAPALNDALAALNGREREAVLLRFFQGLSLAETGGALGVSADAAQMRVSRALEKLRRHLLKAGVCVSGAALAALLPGHAAHSFPAGGAESVVAALSTPGALGTAGANVYGLYQGATKAMWMTNVKIAAALAASVGVAGAVPLVAHAYQHAARQNGESRTAAPPPPAGKAPAAVAGAKAPPKAAALDRHIYVYGEVVRPGHYVIKPGDRTLDALMGVGLMPGADTSRVSDIHLGKGNASIVRTIDVTRFTLRGDRAGNILLVPGDILYVPKKRA